MNLLILIGVVLGGGVIAADRLIVPLPDRSAVVLYGMAAILMLAGMIVSKNAAQ